MSGVEGRSSRVRTSCVCRNLCHLGRVLHLAVGSVPRRVPGEGRPCDLAGGATILGLVGLKLIFLIVSRAVLSTA